MKRVLVTGASGFLGQHLVAALYDRGDTAICLERDRDHHWIGILPSWKKSNQLITVRGSFEQVERAIAEYEVDSVVHLAAQAQVSVAVADPVNTFEANVRGTWQVLEACRRQRVKRVVVASSDKALGDAESPYVDDDLPRASGIYATSKACAEMIAETYRREYGMSIAVTRCGNLYGPWHTNWSTLIPGTIRSIVRGERPRLRSNGSLKRDYLYVADAVDGYLKLVDSTETGAFNFGTGVGSTAMEVVDAIRTLMQSNLEVFFESRSDKPVEIQEQVLDASKAKTVLNWEPPHALVTGLAKTIAWYRDRFKEDK